MDHGPSLSLQTLPANSIQMEARANGTAISANGSVRGYSHTQNNANNVSRGSYYLCVNIGVLLGALCPETSDWLINKWHEHTVLSSEVFPIACHSHNDYWRAKPLLTALEYGCTAVEADVWLSGNDELLVGHTRDSVSSNRTLSSLYLEPLVDILDHANPEQDLNRGSHNSFVRGLNGVFETAPAQSLILLVDFKSNGLNLWPKIVDALQPLRQNNYLTHFSGNEMIQGPITIVVSGKAPIGKVISNPLHDIFYDAPLDLMSSLIPSATDASEIPDPPEPAIPRITVSHSTPSPLESLNLSSPDTYNSTNSYYASISFMKSIGYPVHSTLSHTQLALMRAQIQGAHAQGLKVRYWGIPAWPIGVRNYLWRVMVREGVDYLSVDDVKAVATDNWGPRKGGWRKRWWF